MTEAIRIEGLNEFQRNLKKLDTDLPKALRVALNAASEVVVQRARPRVATASGRARQSVRASSARTAARVTGGGNRAPYYPWLDFGGRVGRARSVHRPFRKEGRYIYDAYFTLTGSGAFQEVLGASLVDVARQAGIEVD